MTNLQELEQKLAEAQTLVETLKKEKEAAERANEKYELQGGGYSLIVTSNGVSGVHASHTSWVEAGLERKTEALAQSALRQIRAFSRMLAYVHEHCPEWEANWIEYNPYKYFVYFDHGRNVWAWATNAYQQSVVVYMDKPTAIKLADDLNSNRFSLE